MQEEQRSRFRMWKLLSYSEHALASGWMTDWMDEWLTDWLTDWVTIWKRCWLLPAGGCYCLMHECLSDCPRQQNEQEADKTLSLLLGAHLLFAFGWRVWRSWAWAWSWRRHRKAKRKKIYCQQSVEHNNKAHTHTLRDNERLCPKCVRLTRCRCFLFRPFRLLLLLFPLAYPFPFSVCLILAYTLNKWCWARFFLN